MSIDSLNPQEAYQQQQKEYEERARLNKEGRGRGNEDEPRWEMPVLTKINYYVETDKIPEDREKLRHEMRKAGIELIDPLQQLQVDARTRFNFSDFSVGRALEMVDRHVTDFQQAVQHVDGFEGFTKPEVRCLAKVQNENLVRIKSFHHLENHTIGFKNFYYDKSGAFKLLVTGRRHGAINQGDMIGMMKPLDGLSLSRPEIDALKIPETEYLGNEISRMTADIEHFERAVGAMNRFNAFKPEGQEMFMKVPQTERILLRHLFATPSTVDYKNDPKTGVDTRINGKEFCTGLLSYYVTADLESDRRRYEATMKALAETGALKILKDLPRTAATLNAAADKKNAFYKLAKDVETVRDRILGGWNSLIKPFSSRLADFAYEQSYNLNTGSQNIAELSYRFKYEPLGKDGWKIVAEIPGPETGQDGVNGRSPLVHELIYKIKKGRGVTDMMPWPDKTKVDEMVLIALGETRGKDPKPIILARSGLAKGAATIGLYPGEAEKKLNDLELEQVKKSRGKMQFNEKALRVLDSMLWIYDLSAEGCSLPMPIKPMYDSFNLYKVMKDSVTNKTVFETINDKEYGTLQDPDYKNMTWYSPDAWEVNMKMIEDVITMMYGRQDPKYVGTFMDNKAGGLGEMIKKMDIGTRAENWKIEVRKSLHPSSPNYKNYEQIEVPKGFIEIMQAAYLLVTHTALVKEGIKIWNKGGWKEMTQTAYWEEIQNCVTVALYEPSKKGDFEHYNETLALMIIAIAEWYADAAVQYNNDATDLKDIVDKTTPTKVSYTEPNPKK